MAGDGEAGDGEVGGREDDGLPGEAAVEFVGEVEAREFSARLAGGQLIRVRSRRRARKVGQLRHRLSCFARYPRNTGSFPTKLRVFFVSLEHVAGSSRRRRFTEVDGSRFTVGSSEGQKATTKNKREQVLEQPIFLRVVYSQHRCSPSSTTEKTSRDTQASGNSDAGIHGVPALLQHARANL